MVSALIPSSVILLPEKKPFLDVSIRVGANGTIEACINFDGKEIDNTDILMKETYGSLIQDIEEYVSKVKFKAENQISKQLSHVKNFFSRLILHL